MHALASFFFLLVSHATDQLNADQAIHLSLSLIHKHTHTHTPKIQYMICVINNRKSLP